MQQIKAVLLDVDGTILDTKEFIFLAFEHAFASQGLTHLSRKDLDAVMGRPLEECYQILAPEVDYVLLCDAHREFQVKNMLLVQPFPNTLSTLLTLKEMGMKLATISTRKIQALQSLDAANITNLFDTIITGHDVTNFKPHPEGIHLALERLGVSAKEAVMVGDSDADVLAGKNAGTTTIGATYGLSAPDILKKADPDYLIHDIGEVLSILSSTT